MLEGLELKSEVDVTPVTEDYILNAANEYYKSPSFPRRRLWTCPHSCGVEEAKRLSAMPQKDREGNQEEYYSPIFGPNLQDMDSDMGKSLMWIKKTAYTFVKNEKCTLRLLAAIDFLDENRSFGLLCIEGDEDEASCQWRVFHFRYGGELTKSHQILLADYLKVYARTKYYTLSEPEAISKQAKEEADEAQAYFNSEIIRLQEAQKVHEMRVSVKYGERLESLKKQKEVWVRRAQWLHVMDQIAKTHDKSIMYDCMYNGSMRSYNRFFFDYNDPDHDPRPLWE